MLFITATIYRPDKTFFFFFKTAADGTFFLKKHKIFRPTIFCYNPARTLYSSKKKKTNNKINVYKLFRKNQR